MDNQIIQFNSGFSKSILVRETEIWVHMEKIKTFEKFEKAINKPGGFLATGAYKIPFSKIGEISFNESSQSTKISYTNDKGKEKKLNLSFSDIENSKQFGQYLGEKLNYDKSVSSEGKIQPLLINGFLLSLSIIGTIMFATMDDTSAITNSSTRRGSGGRAILRLIVDTVGQTGVLIIGGLISLYLGFQLYKRYKNPMNVIRYLKSDN